MQAGQKDGQYSTWQKKFGVKILLMLMKKRLMLPGDCINIPAGVKHWHGAAPDSWFSHLAVEVPGENTSNEWQEPVEDMVYSKCESIHAMGGLTALCK